MAISPALGQLMAQGGKEGPSPQQQQSPSQGFLGLDLEEWALVLSKFGEAIGGDTMGGRISGAVNDLAQSRAGGTFQQQLMQSLAPSFQQGFQDMNARAGQNQQTLQQQGGGASEQPAPQQAGGPLEAPGDPNVQGNAGGNALPFGLSPSSQASSPGLSMPQAPLGLDAGQQNQAFQNVLNVAGLQQRAFEFAQQLPLMQREQKLAEDRLHFDTHIKPALEQDTRLQGAALWYDKEMVQHQNDLDEMQVNHDLALERAEYTASQANVWTKLDNGLLYNHRTGATMATNAEGIVTKAEIDKTMNNIVDQATKVTNDTLKGFDSIAGTTVQGEAFQQRWVEQYSVIGMQLIEDSIMRGQLPQNYPLTAPGDIIREPNTGLRKTDLKEMSLEAISRTELDRRIADAGGSKTPVNGFPGMFFYELRNGELGMAYADDRIYGAAKNLQTERLSESRLNDPTDSFLGRAASGIGEILRQSKEPFGEGFVKEGSVFDIAKKKAATLLPEEPFIQEGSILDLLLSGAPQNRPNQPKE